VKRLLRRISSFLKPALLALTLVILASPIAKTEASPLDGLTFGSGRTVLANNIQVNQTAGASNTVEFWMNWNGAQNVMPISFESGNYDLDATAGCFGFNTVMGECIGINNTSGLVNKWVHVAAVFYNGVPTTSNVKLYINGVQQALTFSTSAYNPVNRTVSRDIRISGYNGGYYFGGFIRSVAVWNYERTATQIQSDMNNGMVGNESGLVGYWKLDPVTTATVYDKTSYKNNGAVSGFTPPSTLSTSNVTDLGASLSWTGLADATSYTLQRDGTTIYNGLNTSLNEKALVSQTTYNYSLIASDANGVSNPSTASITTNVGSLSLVSVPSNFSLTPITLNGTNQTSYGTFNNSIIVRDTRKVRDGWRLVPSSTVLSDGVHPLATNSVKIKPALSVTQTDGSVQSSAQLTATQTQAIDGNPSVVPLVTASSTTGQGVYEIKLPANALELYIKPEAYAGNYQTAITWSVIPGSN
jgi:hypothetical protein